MPKCPECSKDINSLNNFQSGENKYSMILDSNGFPDYDLRDFIFSDRTNDYECPECNKVLFTDEESAVAFLKGENTGEIIEI